MNKISITMTIITIAINSFSLTFSKNYIVTGNNRFENSDTLTVYNNSEDMITIDTIFEEIRVNGQKVDDYAEFSFNFLGTGELNYYYDFCEINDSVFISSRERNNKKLIIKANDSISLYNFILGKCIWCVGGQQASISCNDTFDITIRFKYLNTMSDSIVFHGPAYFFFTGIIPSKKLSKAKKNNQTIYFDLLGRVYEKIDIKNELRVNRVLSVKRNTNFSDK